MESAALASGAGMCISRPRVLVVEDDPICLTTLTQILQRRGYIVTAKASPEEGLRAFQENPAGFDLVMTVVRTQGPGIDGFELLKHAVKRYPVIMFSGFEPWETVMRSIEGGACDFLTKPLRDQELRNIWQHVARRRLTAASDAAAIANTRSSGTSSATKRGSAELDNSDGSRKQGRASFNSPTELRAEIVKAAEQLEDFSPSGIQAHLHVQGVELTIEQVTSHLEKYKRDCLANHLSTMPMASSTYSNNSRNYPTHESLEFYMTSQGATNINQTSPLSKGASSAGRSVLGNETYWASQAGILQNNGNLHGFVNVHGNHCGHSNCNRKYGNCYHYDNANNNDNGNANANANASHYGNGLCGFLPNRSMVSASPMSNVAQTVHQAMPEGHGNGRDGLVPNGNMASASLPSNLAQPVHQAMPTNSLFPSSMVRTMDNPNPIGQHAFPQISRLRYDGNTGGISIVPWSVDDGEELPRRYLQDDIEVMQNTASTGMTQRVHGDGAADQISASQNQNLTDPLISESSNGNGTAGTSGGSGVMSDGILDCEFSADEMEKLLTSREL